MSGAEVAVLDVGQGDCIVLADHAASTAIVVDCPLGRWRVADEFLRDCGLTGLEAIVLTHLDRDHYGGLPTLMTRMPPRRLWMTLAKGFDHSHPELAGVARQFADLTRQHGIEVSMTAPQIAPLRAGSVTVEALGPTGADLLTAQARSDANYASAILRAKVGNLTVLLGGDAPAARWAGLDPAHIRADVLVMPHHAGTFDDQAIPYGLRDLLHAVQPQVVVVSVGSANRYGHPDSDVLGALGEWAARTGGRLVCTQLNELCAVAATHAGNGPQNRSCAGTVRVASAVGTGFAAVTPTDSTHAAIVDRTNAPRCRSALPAER